MNTCAPNMVENPAQDGKNSNTAGANGSPQQKVLRSTELPHCYNR